MESKKLFGLQILQDQPVFDLGILRVADVDGWFWVIQEGLDFDIDWTNSPKGEIFRRFYRAWCDTWAIANGRFKEEDIRQMILLEIDNVRKTIAELNEESLSEEKLFIDSLQGKLGYLNSKRMYALYKRHGVKKIEEIENETTDTNRSN